MTVRFKRFTDSEKLRKANIVNSTTHCAIKLGFLSTVWWFLSTLTFYLQYDVTEWVAFYNKSATLGSALYIHPRPCLFWMCGWFDFIREFIKSWFYCIKFCRSGAVGCIHNIHRVATSLPRGNYGKFYDWPIHQKIYSVVSSVICDCCT